MADRRSTIGVDVQGVDDLKGLNATLNEYEKHLRTISRLQKTGSDRFDSYASGADKAAKSLLQLHRETAYYTMGLRGLQTQTQQTTSQLSGVTRETDRASRSLRDGERATRGFLGSFSEIGRIAVGVNLLNKGLDEAVRLAREGAKAMVEYDYQSARVQRVVEKYPRSQLMSQMRRSAAETGLGAEQQGEGLYQLGTMIRDPKALAEAHSNLMKLVVGTESDVRESARATVTMFYQYGDAIKGAVDDGEKLRRMEETLAISWKQSNTEVQEQIESLKYLGPIAAAAKVPLEQVLGVIGALDKAGIRGSMGGTAPAMMISNLISKYDEKERGIVSKGQTYHFDLARTRDGGMDIVQTLKNIYEIVNKLPQEKAEKFMRAVSGSERSFRSVAALRAALQDMDTFVRNLKEGLDGRTHEIDKLNAKMQDTFGMGLARMWQGTLGVMTSAFDNFASKIGLKGLINDINEAQKGWLELEKMNADTEARLRDAPRRRYSLEMSGNLQSIISHLEQYGHDTFATGVLNDIPSLMPAERNAVLDLLKQRGMLKQGSVFGQRFKMDDLKRLRDDLQYESKAYRLAEQEQSILDRGKKMSGGGLMKMMKRMGGMKGMPGMGGGGFHGMR